MHHPHAFSNPTGQPRWPRNLIASALLAALAGCGGAETANTTLQSVANALNSAATALAANGNPVTPLPEPVTPGTSGTSSGSSTGSTSGSTPGGTATTPPPASPTINTIDTLIGDMTLAHEGTPIAFAGWGTLSGPGLDFGNNPPIEWSYALPWGVIFVAREGSAATNTRVQVRNMRFYVFSKSTRTWRSLGSSATVDGSMYNEDFRQGNDVLPAAVRTEASGGLSVKPVWPYAYHFWCCGRQPFDRSDLGGIYATFQARLVVDDPARPDDRSSARFLGYTGLDYWRDQTSGWAPGQPNNGEAGHGRMKYVTNEWRAFNLTTVDATTLRASPPPLE